MTSPASPPPPPDALSPEEGDRLLTIVQRALGAWLEGAPPPLLEALVEGPVPARLLGRRGAFVTWKVEGTLRGCIGYVEPRGPLWQDVRDLAVASASHDPRFEPVRPEEAEGLTGSVSVLTPARPIAPSEVVVGRHGLILSVAGRRGLLLPQVAPEWGWDREQLLEAMCRKAQVPAGSWRRADAALEAFEAQVFGEHGA